MNYVSLPDYRAANATDDNAALAAALATGKPVYLPAGSGTGSGGAYRIGYAFSFSPTVAGNLPSYAHIFGDGMGRTIVQRYGGQFVFMANSGSSDQANDRLNIRLRDMTIQGVLGHTQLDEGVNLIHLANTRGALIERVEFKEFEGDGIYLGSHINQQPGRNRYTTVRDCVFDGVSRINRNGISIVDGVDWLIENCLFTRTTASTMPGPIDVEPNTGGANLAAKGRVVNCRFVDNGGFAVSLLLGASPNGSSSPVANPYKDFQVEGCVVEDSAGAFALAGVAGTAAETSVEEFAASFRNNYVSNVSRPFLIGGGYGAVIEDNVFEDCDSSMIQDGATSRNLRFLGNRFTRCGNVNGPVIIQDGNIVDVDVIDNHFLDCGKPDGSLGPVWFQRGGASPANIDRLRFIRNRLESPTVPRRTTDLGRRVGGSTAAQNNVEKTSNEVIGFTPTGPNNL